MNSEQRKKAIYQLLEESRKPVTGSSLAEMFGVTRQIIVQDIALLKAEKRNIVSTARGYVLKREVSPFVQRTVAVCHKAEEMEDELQTVVDLGGRVMATSVVHPYYGTLGEALNIKSRKDIQRFLQQITEEECEPLLRLTKGKHSHIIEAETEETLDEICIALRQKGYLLSQ